MTAPAAEPSQQTAQWPDAYPACRDLARKCAGILAAAGYQDVTGQDEAAQLPDTPGFSLGARHNHVTIAMTWPDRDDEKQTLMLAGATETLRDAGLEPAERDGQLILKARPLLWDGQPVRARLAQMRLWMVILGLAGVALVAGFYDGILQVDWHVHIGQVDFQLFYLKPWWDAGSWWPHFLGHWKGYRDYAFRNELEPALAVVFIMSLVAGPAYWDRRQASWKIGIRFVLLVVAGIGLGVLGFWLADFGMPGLWAHAATATGHRGYTLDGAFSWAGRASLFTLAWGAAMGLVLHRIWGPAGATIQGYWTDRIADKGRERGHVAWYVRLAFSWPTLRERYSQLYLDASIKLARPGRVSRGLIATILFVVVLLVALGATGKWWAGHGHIVPYLFPARAK